MQGNYFLVKKIDHDSVLNAHKYVDEHLNRIAGTGKTAAVKVEEYKSPRALAANSLYWLWLSEIAVFLTKKGREATKEDLHDLMRHKFLGYHPKRKVGRTEIGSTLKSTRKLNTSEFCFYLQQIDAWASEIGCFVTSPMDCEYRRFLDKQNK